MTERRPLHSPFHTALALSDVGWHPGAWRLDPDTAARLTDPAPWLDLVRQAEAAAIDLVTFEDGLALQQEGFGEPDPRTDRVRGRLDSTLLAARLSPLTESIGLVPTVITTHTEPFHVAKAVATLDYTSAGRAGVRLKVGTSSHEARLIGRRTLPVIDLDRLDDPEVQQAVEDGFAEAHDVAEVLHRLWDSWEDDAEIRDVPTGRFVDRDKLHYVDFEGRWFSVKGPLITPRPPQGQPLVTVLAHDTVPYRLGAEQADVIFVTPRDAARAAEIVAEIRSLEQDVSRAEPARVVADVVTVLAGTESEAQRRLAELDELAGSPLTSDALVHVGTAASLVDVVASWHAAGVDGVRFRPATHAEDVPRLTADVVPLLRTRGLVREGYSGTTLREHLGLARPANRYAQEVAS